MLYAIHSAWSQDEMLHLFSFIGVFHWIYLKCSMHHSSSPPFVSLYHYTLSSLNFCLYFCLIITFSLLSSLLPLSPFLFFSFPIHWKLIHINVIFLWRVKCVKHSLKINGPNDAVASATPHALFGWGVAGTVKWKWMWECIYISFCNVKAKTLPLWKNVNIWCINILYF